MRTTEQVATAQLDALKTLVEAGGLPSVYKGNFTVYLFDYYADFSWDAHIVDEINRMRSLPEFENVMDGITRVFNFDMRDNLVKAIAIHLE